MFRCDHCGHSSERGEKAYRPIIQKRERTYPAGNHPETGERLYSTGWEVIKEEKWCSHCKADPDWVAKQQAAPESVVKRTRRKKVEENKDAL